ncbi:MAG TPA: flagellar filament capping protein FliD [Gemmatimonadaceae bacterium]|nr:flagellar filament capping protein FliD [Gemmatimonadaceae bacterium]
MAEPIGTVSGLASGIQWRDMIDQIMQLEESRTLTPLDAQMARISGESAAWRDYKAIAARFQTAALALKSADAFRALAARVATSPSGRTLATVSASTTAVPGTYGLEVLSVARAEKIGGRVVTDAGAALGASGQFVVNGKGIAIDVTDSLNAVRDRINAANSGTSPTKVTAAIQTSGGRAQLVLSSDSAGVRGIELADVRRADGAPSALEALGLASSGGTAANYDADGLQQSGRISSVSLAMAQALGVLVDPPPSTVMVNGEAIVVDLATESISDIVAKINAKSPGTASIETRTDGGATLYRMKVAGTVTSDGTDGSQRTLEALGLVTRARDAVAQRVTTNTVLTDASTGLAATGATGLASLATTGGSATPGILAGDTITLVGTDGAGAVVRHTYAATGTDTLADLATSLAGAFGGGRAASVSIVDGKLELRDSVTGTSMLTATVTASLASGDTLDFGGTTTDVGRAIQLAAGADATVKLDGRQLTSRSNTFTNAIDGLSLTVQAAEVGTTVDLTVARDIDSTVQTAKDLVDAYNAVVAFVEKESGAKGRLPFNGSLRSSLSSLKHPLLSDVAGLSASTLYNRGSLVGLTVDRYGTLTLDETAFRNALATNRDQVEKLFATNATSSSTDLQYVAAGDRTVAGAHAVVITRAATQSAFTGTAVLARYTDDGTPDTMTLRDDVSGKATDVRLTDGDTVATLVDKLNAAFQSDGLGLVASDAGGQLRIAHKSYGAVGSFTVSYSAGGTDATSQLGIAAGTYANGADVQGSIDGQAATGLGQELTDATGLIVRYTGTTDTASATLDYVLGLGGALAAQANGITDETTGFVKLRENAASTTQSLLAKRQDDIQARLDRKREALVRQFTAMEAAMSRIQSQGAWLGQQITALQAMNASGTR